MVSRILGAWQYLHTAAISVLTMPGRNSFRHDRRLGVATHVDHLRASVRLLVVVGQRDRVELADRVIPAQYHRRVLPCDCGASLNLRPGNLRFLRRHAALRHEVVNATLAVLGARVPVLDCRVFDLAAVQRHELHHSRMELTGAPDRCRTTL